MYLVYTCLYNSKQLCKFHPFARFEMESKAKRKKKVVRKGMKLLHVCRMGVVLCYSSTWHEKSAASTQQRLCLSLCSAIGSNWTLAGMLCYATLRTYSTMAMLVGEERSASFLTLTTYVRRTAASIQQSYSSSYTQSTQNFVAVVRSRTPESSSVRLLLVVVDVLQQHVVLVVAVAVCSNAALSQELLTSSNMKRSSWSDSLQSVISLQLIHKCTLHPSCLLAL